MVYYTERSKNDIELTGNLKKRLDEAADISEKEKCIEQAGENLNDELLEMVSGGRDIPDCTFGEQTYVKGRCRFCSARIVE